MSNYMEEAFAPALAKYKAQVMAETWGHLAPTSDRRYDGYMIFACGAYGDIVLLQADFEDLPDSPWFYEDAQDFIAGKTERGFLYRFVGTYEKFDNGEFNFDGRIVKCEMTSETRISNQRSK